MEAVLLADVVERALLEDGAYGLLDLAIAGSSIGGLGKNDVDSLVGAVDERLARLRAHAA